MNSAALPMQRDLAAAIPRLRRYARVLTGNPTRADDLVHETLVRAWDTRGLRQVGPDPRTWLFTIMHDRYVRQHALARRAAGSLAFDSETGCGVARKATEHGNQPDRTESQDLVRKMGCLPVEQREVLLLAAVEALRYGEIAAALAIPIGTVMSRLSRARDELRRMTEEPPSARDGMKDARETGRVTPAGSAGAGLRSV